jgi:uncharacterized membrane protein
MSDTNILLVGETWYTLTYHIKGADHFSIGEYTEAGENIIRAIESNKMDLDRVPCHLVSQQFPKTTASATEYDIILFSDIGYNSFVSPEMKEAVDLRLLTEYVKQGGGFGMIGGYMSYAGLQGRGAYHNTPVETVLPVDIHPWDDRIEHPDGVSPRVVAEDHPIADGLPREWPPVLGYHDVEPNGEATVVARCGDDPFLVTKEYGEGRSFAYLTDCEPEWAPSSFLSWEQHDEMWGRILQWASGGA